MLQYIAIYQYVYCNVQYIDILHQGVLYCIAVMNIAIYQYVYCNVQYIDILHQVYCIVLQ